MLIMNLRKPAIRILLTIYFSQIQIIIRMMNIVQKNMSLL